MVITDMLSYVRTPLQAYALVLSGEQRVAVRIF
jgi:hypothetical protein